MSAPNNDRRRLQVYYDDWCPLCTALRDRLLRLDWLGRLSFCPIRPPALLPPGLTPADAAARMHAIDPATGRFIAGIDAVAAVSARLPLLWPLWPGLRLLSAIGLGQAAYDFIASRRAILPAGNCDGDACPIHAKEPQA